MNGIEKITKRIEEEADQEVRGILLEARNKADELEKSYAEEAAKKAAELKAKAEKAASEREERLISVAQMQARQVILAAKQDVVTEAFDLALKELEAENIPDCRTQLRLRRPEISVELAKLLFPEA